MAVRYFPSCIACAAVETRKFSAFYKVKNFFIELQFIRKNQAFPTRLLEPGFEFNSPVG